MKRIFLLLSVLFGMAFGAEYIGDYKEGMALAQKENKLMMLTVVQTNCPWCHKFLRETLKEPKIAQIIKQNFVMVVLNRDIHEIPAQFRAKLAPTTFFINLKGEKIGTTVPGYVSANDFDDFITEAVKKK